MTSPYPRSPLIKRHLFQTPSPLGDDVICERFLKGNRRYNGNTTAKYSYNTMHSNVNVFKSVIKAAPHWPKNQSFSFNNTWSRIDGPSWWAPGPRPVLTMRLHQVNRVDSSHNHSQTYKCKLRVERTIRPPTCGWSHVTKSRDRCWVLSG